MKGKIFLLTICVVCLAAFLFHKGVFFQFSEGEVDMLEKVEIGGVEQWIMANGESSDLPVLLWLHGGPGAAQMSGRYFNGALEENFIVVHWDQRGAGKSNHSYVDQDSLHVEQFLSDVEEMTNYLQERFDREKIFLLGHSWGSYIGILSVHENPENYHGYIGVSQIVFLEDQQILAHEELVRRIELDNIPFRGERNLQILSELDGPPYSSYEDYGRFAGLMSTYGMNIDLSFPELAFFMVGSGVYDAQDYMRWIDGAKRGAAPMWDLERNWDIPLYVSELEVPCLFIFGEDDYTTPFIAAKDFLEDLDAPKKEVIIIEDTAHTPFFKNPQQFALEVIDFGNGL